MEVTETVTLTIAAVPEPDDTQSFCEQMEATEEEFFILWQHRLVDAEGNLRTFKGRTTHFATAVATLQMIRNGMAVTAVRR